MPFSVILRKFIQRPLAVCAFIIVSVFFLIGIIVEIWSAVSSEKKVLTPWNMEHESAVYQAPSGNYYLGTDYRGRSVLAKAVAGTNTALKVGIISGIISAFIGCLLGIVAGFFGGWRDEIVVWLYSTFASMPTLLFILGFALLFSRNFISLKFITSTNIHHFSCELLAIYIAIGLTGWVNICRVVRAETMKLKKSGFVLAANVAGIGYLKIIFHHILPNVLHLVIIYFTLNCAGAIMLEVIVSYLGFGAKNIPSWGLMISDGQECLWRGIWWEISAATLFMFVLVLSLNILGDALRDITDPR